MAHLAPTPVFVGLRAGLHVLVVGLTAFVGARALLSGSYDTVAVLVCAAVFLATYVAGGLVVGGAPLSGRFGGLVWLAAVTLEWVVLVWLIPDAAYLAFPLFFLDLHLLGGRTGIAAVAATAVVSVIALGLHGGWTVGGVVGPLIGAAVAVMIGLGYQALAREAAERERLLAELAAARGRLAATEREAGILAERARLAREIHDTVAQGLSSIQLLLHAAERADPDGPGVEHVRLARETAAAGLADTRRFIRELTPPNLDDDGLGGALRRLAATHWAPQGLAVHVRVSDAVPLPMHLQAALLRIAQGAIANVVQHAEATNAEIVLTVEGDRVRFVVADDGRGFETGAAADASSAGRTDSFGLQAARERIEQLGGTLQVDSAPGRGTTVAVELALDPVGPAAGDGPDAPVGTDGSGARA
ncbi:sensor histidine kinase [Agromyces seonyuensis]|uniref:Sensor histidine kinase n=1 Tax=Agromyces seonyuensis TaxID=2662446 RepID=A0A6I4P6B3_9MICO|nr:sensor histidine kinase [Agromyces seonyuensis]MWB99144.1 sensor histidine kinase [Agromyces seonyuensis]